MPLLSVLRWLPSLSLFSLVACGSGSGTQPPQGNGAPGPMAIGLVTDVGGRGDQSFNDGALRGLETWAAGLSSTPHGYEKLAAADRDATIPEDLRGKVGAPENIAPMVLVSRQQEDYQPNLQVLVDEGVKMAVGVGFMLENAVEFAARRNAGTRFLLIDSPLLDPNGEPLTLPNVKTVTFREQEGTFLVGAMAGMVTRSNVVGFVGGMQIPLIRKFETGFRAGLMTTNPAAGKSVLVGYTGSFDRVEAGKQVAQDMISKNADVIFQAAGADGLGAIAAAREAGRFAIGCDSDQHHVAPEAIFVSMLKHTDFAVYSAVRDEAEGRFQAGNSELGLREGGLGITPITSDRITNAVDLTTMAETLRKLVVDGEIRVPATVEELATFVPPRVTVTR
jgi:basic membrane protein A and related proteins